MGIENYAAHVNFFFHSFFSLTRLNIRKASIIPLNTFSSNFHLPLYFFASFSAQCLLFWAIFWPETARRVGTASAMTV